MESYNNYVKIDTDALLHNYRAVAKKAGVPVMAVVKADAYGHGTHLPFRSCRYRISDRW